MFKKILLMAFCPGAMAVMGQQGRAVNNQPVMPGPAGVFLFMQDTAQHGRITDHHAVYTISREKKKNAGFKKIMELSFPSSPAELEKRLRAGILQEILLQRHLKSAADLYAQLEKGRYDTLGLFAASPDVLTALGMLWVDREITRNDPDVGYKVEATRNGNTRVLYERHLRDTRYTPFPRFRRYSMNGTDSAATATWYTTDGKAGFARVYASLGNSKTYTMAIRSFVYRRRDTLFATYTTSVKKGDRVSFFMRPEDFAGNMGQASDTVNLLALSFNNMLAIKSLRARDTLGGILLNWDSLPSKAYYSGIRVMKSRSATDNYVTLDTLPAGAHSYLDRKIIMGVQYYYNVMPIMYDLPQKAHVAPATITGMARVRSGRIHAPQGIRLSFTEGRDIRISWLPNSELTLFAYYVLRGTSPKNMKVVSPAVRDTVFVDSAETLNAGTTYLYAVKAMDLDMKNSDTSEAVSILPAKGRVVAAPAGLTARFTEQGIRLAWNDTRLNDASVIGYMIYKRKKGEQYFTPLTRTFITGDHFTDTAVDVPGLFEYGCTAADAWNNQSLLSPLASVEVPGSTYLYAPPGPDLRNLATGIEISVPPSVKPEAGRQYLIYRRSISDKQYHKIGKMPLDHAVYLDRQVSKQQLYVYRLSASLQNMESRAGEEKSIRRK